MESQAKQLQTYVNWLAENYVPALRGAKVICFLRQFEVWHPAGFTTLVVGSHGTVMVWLGCVALTKHVRSYAHIQPEILHVVIWSAERAKVL